MHHQAELHIEEFVEQFVQIAVILVLAVLLCLDMCNIIDISKGNFTAYE
jgi:hypothetical protein